MLEKLSLFVPTPRLNEYLILKEVNRNPDIKQDEIAQWCHLSTAMVNVYLKALVKKGYLEYEIKNPKVIRYIITDRGVGYGIQVRGELEFEVAMLYREIFSERQDKVIPKS